MFTRQRITAAVAAFVAAAGLSVAGLAATANAATPPANPGHHATCELDGRNVVSLTYLGTTYNYPAVFETARDGLVTGWLHDGYEPVPLNLPVNGVAIKSGRDCDVVFSVVYPDHGPDAGNQGVRTFSGALDHRHLAGAVSETGTEDLAVPFSLLFPVH